MFRLLGLTAAVLTAHGVSAQVITNAYDVGTNYATAGNFYTGDNQGIGFGPWNLNLGSGSQTLTANDTLQFGQYAFTLINSDGGGISTATRPFGNPLPVGGSFSVRFELNHLDNGSDTNGFQLQDASGNVLFSFWHVGGDNGDGHYLDAVGQGTATNFTYNFMGFTRLSFTLTSATTYTFADINTGASFTGMLSGAAIRQVMFFRANGTDPTSDGQNFEFNALAITTLGAKPVFTVQPKNVAGIGKGTISLSALATSNLGTPSYQWYFQNAPIAGATSTNLTLANLDVTNGGAYYVVAANTAGSATSVVAVVTVVPFGFTNAYDTAANYTAFTGNQGSGFGPWTLSTAGGGSYISGDHLFGIWNGTAEAASTALRPIQSPIPAGGSFLFQLQFNSLESLNTNAVELLDASGNVVFSFFHVGGDVADGWYMDANGTGAATGFAYDYQQVDSYAFTLTTATTYVFSDLTTGQSFTGTISGAPIAQILFVRGNGPNQPGNGQDLKFDNLTILSPEGGAPQFVLQPQYAGGLVGSTLSLGAIATSSTGTAAYQWYFGTAPIAGATSTNLLLSSVSLATSGNYWVVATNTYGATTSSVAVVTVYVENNRLLAYEGFDYPGGPSAIDGSQDGGQGWSGAWVNVSGSGNFIQDNSLSGDTNVPSGYDSLSHGNSYFNYGSSRAGRWLDCSSNGVLAARGYLDAQGNIGAAGKTLYVSFLQQPLVPDKFYEFEFHRADLGDPGRIAGVGNDTATTDVYFRNPNGAFSDMGAGDSSAGSTGNLTVDFYVVRIDFQPGHADNVFIYRNPASVNEPATPTLALTNVGNMSFNGISLGAYNGNEMALDEIRLGSSWTDVQGVVGANNMWQVARLGVSWKVQFAGNPSFTYRVQRAPSVTGPWTDIGTATPGETGVGTVTDASPLPGQAFYRTVTP